MKILKSGVFSVPYVTGQAIDWISPSVNSFIQWLNMHWELGTEPGGGGKKDNMTSVCSGALKVLWVPGVAFLLNREVSPEFPQMWDSQFLNQRRQWHPTPVLLPGKFHGRRSLFDCSPWGRWGSDTAERLHFHFSLSFIGEGNGNPLQFLAWRTPGTGERGGLPSMGSHRVGHDWSEQQQEQQQQQSLELKWDKTFFCPN